MTVYTIQASFARGEISPRLHGRVDIDHYAMGLASAKNFFVLRQGGLRKRSGTVYVGPIKDESSSRTKLHPFVFDANEAYAIEFGEEYCRFFAMGGQVYSGGNPYEITSPYGLYAVLEIQMAQSADVLYIAHRNYPPKTLTRSSETSWAFADYQALDGPYFDLNTTSTYLKPNGRGAVTATMTSNSAPSGTVTSSPSSTDAYKSFDTDFVEYMNLTGRSGSLTYTFDPGDEKAADAYWLAADDTHMVRTPVRWKLSGLAGATWVVLDSRTGETGWGSGERRYYKFVNKTAYDAYRFEWENVDDAVNDYSRIGELGIHWEADDASGFTITASSTTGINNGEGFKSSDVGRSIRIMASDGIWRWVRITEYTSTTQVKVVLYEHSLPDISAISNWQISAWSGVAGYPWTVGFYQNRLVWGGTYDQPRTVWLSGSADYDSFSTSSPVEDSDGINLTMSGGRQDAISFIQEGYDLIVGTSGGMGTIGPAANGEAFSATNVESRQHSSVAAARIPPVQIDNVTVFVNYYKNKLHEFAYSYETNSYRAPELTILSDHLFSVGIEQIAYQASPSPIIWALLKDGTLAAVTYERDQQVVGVTQVEIAGSNKKVDSICVVPTEDGDRLWMICKRRINGSDHRYVEYLDDPFDGDDVENGIFFDSAVTVTNATAFSTITGADHLEGETVGVLADGVDIGDAVVSSGGFTLPMSAEANTVTYGLRYEAYGETLRAPTAGNRDGSALGRRMRVVNVHADVLETGYLEIGSDYEQYNVIERSSEESLDTPVELYTGLKEVSTEDSWANNGVVVFRSDRGYPATLRALNIGLEGEP